MEDYKMHFNSKIPLFLEIKVLSEKDIAISQVNYSYYCEQSEGWVHFSISFLNLSDFSYEELTIG